jgi:hypothetical protein
MVNAATKETYISDDRSRPGVIYHPAAADSPEDLLTVRDSYRGTPRVLPQPATGGSSVTTPAGPGCSWTTGSSKRISSSKH